MSTKVENKGVKSQYHLRNTINQINLKKNSFLKKQKKARKIRKMFLVLQKFVGLF